MKISERDLLLRVLENQFCIMRVLKDMRLGMNCFGERMNDVIENTCELLVQEGLDPRINEDNRIVRKIRKQK